MNTDKLLTLKEIQELFGRSRTWVYHQRKTGKIKPSKIDKRRFSSKEIEQLCQSA